MALSSEHRQRLVDGYMRAAARDLKAAELIVDNAAEADFAEVAPIAAYHLQQSAEKVAKAHFAARDHLVTKEHRLSENIRVIASEPTAADLGYFTSYDKFATTTRYPSSSGKLADGPSAATLTEDIEKLRALVEKVRLHLGAPELSRTPNR